MTSGATPEEMLFMVDTSRNLEIGSVHHRADIQKAVEFMLKGEPIGLSNRGVCAIAGDGGNDLFFDEVASIKGEERKDRPLAAMFPPEQMLEYLDMDLVPEPLRAIFASPETVTSRLGSLCFLQIPITEKASLVVPVAMQSRHNGVPILQNWIPNGHPPAHHLVTAMKKAGIAFPAITSMNVSGQPEIVDQDLAVEFARKTKIPLFLRDEKATQAKGSYTTIAVEANGKLRVIRDGNVPAEALSELFGKINMDWTGTKDPKYPQVQFPTSELNEDPTIRRMQMLLAINNESVDNVHAITAGLHLGKHKRAA